MIKYYDFLVGIPGENPKEWKLQKLKLAAMSPEMAVYTRQFLRVGRSPKRDRKYHLGKDDDNKLSLAYMSVRKIIEYDLTATNGNTRYTFKKVNEYRIDKNLKIV
ncbi:hypothetical protein [Aureispira sp. CCB-QB1]|uniref:hypothetical protein n=1 Tax=Aureispira sp. CCB-QB1 TaxID=1313421 RepID=UPI000696E485|nr:hypothetical protein [Aureispira sp. CCB-QB1]